VIETHDPGLQFYVDQLTAAQPFTLVRYGDGEWSSIVGDRPTCIGQRLDLPGLPAAMMDSIRNCPRDDHYYMACHPDQARGNIEAWLKEHQPAWLKWYDNRTLYKASMHGALYPFVAALRTLPVPLVVIGPAHLRKLGDILPVAAFIEIPGVNAWPTVERILDAAQPYAGACFSISAGPTSSPLVYRMWRRGLRDGWLLDVGSLWDVFCGKRSRTYHTRIDDAKLRRNLTGV